MELDWIAMRKLAAGVVAILLASGIIKWEYVAERRGLQIALYIIGGLLILLAAAYQFNIIPEASSDMLLNNMTKMTP